MSSNENEIAFLTRILSYDEGPESRKLATKIVQAETDERCIQRMLRRSAWLLALTIGGITIWGASLIDGNSSTGWISGGPVANGLFGLGLGALISCLVLASLGAVYRKRLGQRREEARRFAVSLLEIRLGRAALPTLMGQPTAAAEGASMPSQRLPFRERALN